MHRQRWWACQRHDTVEWDAAGAGAGCGREIERFPRLGHARTHAGTHVNPTPPPATRYTLPFRTRRCAAATFFAALETRPPSGDPERCALSARSRGWRRCLPHPTGPFGCGASRDGSAFRVNGLLREHNRGELVGRGAACAGGATLAAGRARHDGARVDRRAWRDQRPGLRRRAWQRHPLRCQAWRRQRVRRRQGVRRDFGSHRRDAGAATTAAAHIKTACAISGGAPPVTVIIAGSRGIVVATIIVTRPWRTSRPAP